MTAILIGALVKLGASLAVRIFGKGKGGQTATSAVDMVVNMAVRAIQERAAAHRAAGEGLSDAALLEIVQAVQIASVDDLIAEGEDMGGRGR